MPMLFALAVSIGLLAVLATWLFLTPLHGYDTQVWQAFVAWACYYHCGGKITGVRNTILGMSFGALIGMLSVLLSMQLGGLGQFAAPVAVGVGAAVIVLSAHLSLLSTIPASVYGFACIAGLILLGTDMSPQKALLPTVVSIVIGAIFGYVSELIGNALAKKNAGT